MNHSKLQIVAVMSGEKPKKDSSPQQTRRHEAQAKYERLWHLEPERFDPYNSSWGKKRIERTLTLFRKHGKFEGAKCVDLGTGWGVLTLKCAEEGGMVDTVDIATQPLDRVKGKYPSIHTFQDYVPHTLLNEETYDVVLATEIVAELPVQEMRLFFSELARLVKKDGLIVCSTSLDIYSIDAFERFRTLAETELDIIDSKLSYNYLWIKLENFLSAPNRFSKAGSDPAYRERKIQERHGLIRKWFQLNSSPILGHFWKCIGFLSNPLQRSLYKQGWLLHSLESVSQLFWGDQALSHVIIVGRRRPIIPPSDFIKAPPERQQKRRLWE